MRIHRNEKYMMAATSGCRRRSVFKMSDIETTDVDMFTIGNNLRELREQKRVTHMQVVDVLEVSIPIWDKAMLAQIVMLVMVVFLLRKLSDNRNKHYYS